MLNCGEIEILELDPPVLEHKQEVKENIEVQKKSKIVPFFLVCVSILVITQIVVLASIIINNI